MNKLISGLLIVIGCFFNPVAYSQSIFFGQNGSPVDTSLHFISPYAYNVVQGYGPFTSLTSSSITVATGNLIFVACGSDQGTSNPTASGVTVGTWVSVGDTGPKNIQIYAAKVTSSGTATFTCQFNGSTYYCATIAMAYANSPSTVALNGSGVTNTGVGAPISLSLTTSARTLNIQCAYTNFIGWSSGTVGGNAATLRAVAAANLTSTSSMGCQEYISTGSLSSVTSTIGSTAGGGDYWAGAVMAISY